MKKTRTKKASTIKYNQIFRALYSGSAEEVGCCLSQADCDPLARDDYGRTALMVAVMFGHEGCVRLLLPVSDMLSKDKGGCTALMLAAHFGHEECVKLLLPVSDPLAVSNTGRSASQIARDNGCFAVASMIDAYALAQKETALLSTDILPAPPSRTPVIRM